MATNWHRQVVECKDGSSSETAKTPLERQWNRPGYIVSPSLLSLTPSLSASSVMSKLQGQLDWIWKQLKDKPQGTLLISLNEVGSPTPNVGCTLAAVQTVRRRCSDRRESPFCSLPACLPVLLVSSSTLLLPPPCCCPWLPREEPSFFGFPKLNEYQWLSKNLLGLQAGVGLLMQPASWTEKLLRSQPLQCAGGHCGNEPGGMV